MALNQKFYCYGLQYTSDAEKPMIPTDCAVKDMDEVLRTFYGNVELTEHGPTRMGVPRHINLYTVLRVNSNRTLIGYISNDEGLPHIDKFVDRFNFVPKIGQKIIDWHYKPENVFLTIKIMDIPLYYWRK